MKTFFAILLLISTSSCNKNQTNEACIIFEKHLKVVEEFVNVENEKIDGEILDESILFLENLTGIKSSFTENYEPIKLPTKEDWIKWKNWYVKNKSKIMLDSNRNVINKTN